MPWNLEHVEGASEQTAAEWGLQQLRIRRVSQGVDMLTFVDPAAAYDAAPTFAFDDTVKLKDGSTTIFVGRIASTEAIGENGREGRQYQVAGPWSWLEQIVYQQTWHTTNGADDTVIEETRSRIVLGQDKDGAKITTGAEMTAAINWAIAAGAPITLGTIDASVTIPYQELIDVTCAELIRACLRWTPDAQAWFDYSTATPTLHIRRRANLTAATINLTTANKRSLRITSRDDLQRPAVWLNYEKSHSYNGDAWSTTEVDKYPAEATGLEPRAFVATIDLEGGNRTVEIQKLVTDDIAETSKAFWKEHIAALEGYEDGDITIASATVQQDDGAGGLEASSLVKYIKEGAVNDWMTGVEAKNVVVTAKISYTGSTFPNFSEVVMSVNLIGTDAAKSEYSRLTSFDAPEATPTGLAQALYDAFSFLHYQGSITIQEAEASGLASPGNTLRLSNGLTAWATMDALVQQVEENLDSGETTITFGPPEHLGPSDLVSLLRANRTARASYRLKERSDATKGASGGVVNGPQKTAKQNGTVAPSAGGGGGSRFFGVSISGSGALPSVASLQSAVAGAYSSHTPQNGDFVVSNAFVFAIATSLTAGSLPSSSIFAFSFSVSSVTYYAFQVGPNRLWG